VCSDRLSDGRSHSDALVGWIVWSTTASSSAADDQQADTDRVAAEAVAIVAESYARELVGRTLNRRQREMADRAARLARTFTRKDGRR
jgi:hypothetical protein